MSPSPSYDAITIHELLEENKRLNEIVRNQRGILSEDADAFKNLREAYHEALIIQQRQTSRYYYNSSSPDSRYMCEAIKQILNSLPVLTIVTDTEGDTNEI